VLLVEQDARSALGIADRVYVMEHRHIVRAGTSAEIAADDSVRQAYLGV
jgi:branched-chain amino acid transport system ATP-binding protein